MSEHVKALISAREIDERVSAVAAEISHLQGDNELIVVGILKGSFVFVADLIRKLTCPVRVEFISVTMEDDNSHNRRKIEYVSDFEIAGSDILIVEDILDTGITIDFLKGHMLMQNPKSLKICTLLDKTEAHRVEVLSDYCCFDIPNEFVVGYGLDHDGKFRELPYIGVVEGVTWALAEEK